MKRLLLLPILILGLSFACNQPFEEVEGIKIGCPYTGGLSTGTPKNEDPQITVYEQRLENSFFDTAEIEVVAGKVESISLSKIFHDLASLKKGRDILFTSLNEKWGDAIVLGDNESLIIYVNKSPKSEYLDSVMVMSSFIESAGILQATYTSKALSTQ